MKLGNLSTLLAMPLVVAGGFRQPSVSCKEQDRFSPSGDYADCFRVDPSIEKEFGIALEYARRVPMIDSRIQEICQVLDEDHGGYRLPIHKHQDSEFVLDTRTDRPGHNARIHWNPNKKSVDRKRNGTISEKAVSPAMKLFASISSAYTVFSNPNGYIYGLLMYHPDYQTIEQARIGQEMNETRRYHPEGDWSAHPYDHNLYAPCVLDTDGLVSKPILGGPPFASFIEKFHKARHAEAPHHDHIVPMTGLRVGGKAKAEDLEKEIRSRFDKRRSPHDPLVGIAEDLRRSVILGEEPDARTVRAYEQKALNTAWAMGKPRGKCPVPLGVLHAKNPPGGCPALYRAETSSSEPARPELPRAVA